MSSNAINRRGGRGTAILQALRLRAEQERTLGQNGEKKTAVGRGSLLALLKNKQLSRVGGTISDKENSVESVTESRISNEPSKLNRPDRSGTAGTKIDLATNYLKLTKVNETGGIFHYDVRFSPQLDSKNERFKCLSQHGDVIGRTKTFDGFFLYLPFKLPNLITTLKSRIRREEDEFVYTVTIRFIKESSFTDPSCVKLYNVLFRRIMATLQMVQMNQNYYLPAERTTLPQHNLEIWPGFVTSVDNYGNSGVLLECNVSYRVLRTETVRDMMFSEYLKAKQQNKLGLWKAMCQKAIIGRIILTRYNNKTYRIDDINFEETPKSTFKDYTGENVRYVDYYKRHYNIIINDDEQPLLVHIVKPSRGDNTVSLRRVEQIRLIPELCFLTGLSDPMRSDYKLMKDLTRITKVSPEERLMALKKFVRNIYNNPEAHAHLKNWGLELSRDTLRVQGRVLPKDRFYFGNNVECQLNEDFSREVTTNAVLTPVHLVDWILIFDQSNAHVAQLFVNVYKNCCGRNLGIEVGTPKMVQTSGNRVEPYIRALKENVTSKTQIVVTILPSKKGDLYSAIKKICFIEKVVLSQVIIGHSLSRARNVKSIIDRIALQINCKLGGELWGSVSPYKNAMIIGIDVYHDPEKKSPSFLAFVASMNRQYSRWYSTTEAQQPHIELGNALTTCCLRALKAYKENNGVLPDRIIIYRDGVGEGRFSMVLDHEVPQIQRAVGIFDDYSVKLTIVIVSKRINARLLAIDTSSEGSYKNPPPGTVQDTVITERRAYPNFFLISQKVGEGTVSPTHYTILYDNSNVEPDHIQRLSYKLTHMYYNWPGPIRVPAPCQYADKLAGLIGESVKKDTHPSLSNKLYYL